MQVHSYTLVLINAWAKFDLFWCSAARVGRPRPFCDSGRKRTSNNISTSLQQARCHLLPTRQAVSVDRLDYSSTLTTVLSHHARSESASHVVAVAVPDSGGDSSRQCLQKCVHGRAPCGALHWPVWCCSRRRHYTTEAAALASHIRPATRAAQRSRSVALDRHSTSTHEGEKAVARRR